MFFFIESLNSPLARSAPMNNVEAMQEFEPGGQRRQSAETAENDASGWQQLSFGQERNVFAAASQSEKRGVMWKTSC
jgi:hypothetical protein